MKKSKFIGIVAIVLVAALVVGAAAAVVANLNGTPTVTFDYNQKSFVFSNVEPADDDHNHEYPNLFQEKLTNLVPGDNASQTIKVEARNLAGGSVRISLKTEPDLDNITDTEQVNYTKLLNSVESVKLTVARDGTEISSGSLADGVVLGTFAEGDEMDLTVTLDIPITAGNELQGLQAAIAWVFTAEYFPYYSGGGSDGPALNTNEHYAYIIGWDDGLVHPEATITRAEVATIFFRMLTEDSRNQYWSTTNPYSDVAADDWFNNAVSTLTNAGIFTGKPGNVFDPYAPITRAEFAAIAVRFFGGDYEGEDMFSDIAGHWANKEINLAALKDLVEGMPDGTFQPDREITRAEAMTIVNRVLDRAPVAEHLLDGMITWPDNMDTTKWYYAAVQEATNSHSYTIRYDENGEKYEIWTELLPVRDWAALEQMWSNANSSSNPGEVISSKNYAFFD